VKNALDAAVTGLLPVAGYVGATVTVTSASPAANTTVYTITFGGTLAQKDVPAMSATGFGAATNNVSAGIQFDSNPFYGKGISKIVVDPQVSSTLYVANGDGGTGQNETQRLSFNGFATGQQFQLTFTGADSTGTVTPIQTGNINFYGNSAAQRQQTAND